MPQIDSHPCDASPWVVRFAPLLPPGARVLDLACGHGRHARFFLARQATVTCVDKDISGVSDLSGRAELIAADLEDSSPWPLPGRSFEGIVVTNYLHRPLMPRLAHSLAPSGLLIYETFAVGNGQFGRPRNPDFLLRPGELLEAVRGHLQVIAYETGVEHYPASPRVIQRICAIKGSGPAPLFPQAS